MAFNNLFRLFYSIILLIGCPISAIYAQNYTVVHYTKKDGLPSNHTYQAEQDFQGNIWITTTNGVSKFNGKNFINYNSQNGLPENAIFGAYAVDSGMLFSPLLNKLTFFKNNRFNPVFSEVKNSTNNFIVKGKDNLLYVSDGPGRDIKIFRKFKHIATIPFDEQILYTYIDYHTKELLVYTRSTIDDIQKGYEFNALGISSNHKLKVHCINKNTKTNCYFAPNRFHYFCANVNGKNTLCYFQDSQLIIHPFSKINHKTIKSIYSITDSNECIITNKGVYFLNHYSNKITDSFLVTENCNYVTIDEDHNLWITTSNGLFYLKKTIITSPDYYREKNITEINYIGNSLLFAFDSTVVVKEKDFFQELKCFTGSSIRNILPINDKSALINNYHLHVLTLPPQPFTIQSFITSEDYKSCSFNDSAAFCSTISGVKKIGYPFTLHHTGFLNYDNLILKGTRINCAVSDTTGNLWIGTSKGLYRHTNSETVEKINQLSDYNIFKINNNKSGVTFFLSESNGIYFYRRQKFHWIKLETNKEYLSINSIASSYDTLIVSTNQGVFMLDFDSDYKTFSQVSFTVNDGLNSNEVNKALLHHNELFCATDKGVSIIHLSHPYTISRPKIYLDYLTINHFDTLFNCSEHFTMNYVKDNFLFHLNGICFESGDNILYKYRLKGYENDWNISADHLIKYSSLQPGDYEFEAKSVNHRGIESEATVLVKFSISPPFWLSWWFIILLMIITAVVIGYIFRLRIAQIKKEAAEKNELNKQFAKLELDAIKGNMNPHFIFNALNSIHHYMINNNVELSEKYLLQFSSLMRQVLQQSTENFTSIRQEIKFLETYLSLEKMRFGESFDYSIQTQEVFNYDLEIPTFLIQPFVENCTKHAFDKSITHKKITVRFIEKEENLIIHIEDNGLGILHTRKLKPDIDYTSFGRKIVDARKDVYNKIYSMNILVEEIDKSALNNGETGTLVIITIPHS